mgnify:CR=1 FL=1
MDCLHLYPEGNPVSDEPYHYTQCGLDNIYLHGGFNRVMVDDEEFISINNIDGLWKVIGIEIVTTEGNLNPQEIRFLRSHMRLTQEELAKKLGVDTQTVARWEKEQSKIPGPADLAIRTLFLTSDAAAPEGSEVITRLYSIIEESEKDLRPEFSAIHLIRTMDGWAIDHPNYENKEAGQ